MAESPIRIANRVFSIEDACVEVGMGIVSGMAKAYCPFGVFHADGGRSRSFRVYPETNSAWCFACQEYFTPVRLVAREKGWDERKTAEYVLDLAGWVPPNFEDQWKALHEKENAVDYDALSDALKIACARMAPDWEDRQYEPQVAAKLQQCLSLVRSITNDEEAAEWLAVTKQAMSATLRV